MNDRGAPFTPCRSMLVAVAVAAALVGGCANQPTGTGAPSAATATSAAPEPKAAEAPKPAPPPAVPELSPAQAKAQAQKLALEGIDQLQNGDEAAARATLEQAIALDGTNELARKLRDQIDADPEKELGTVFFRYTVQRDDSMSKLAQQYLGDRFRFYILARYNDMRNPSRLAAGQVIKIPGKAPPPPAVAPVARPAKPEPTTPAPEALAKTEPPPETSAQQESRTLVQKGVQFQKSGNLEAAYAAFNDAVRRDPNNRDAATQRDAVKQALIRRYDREAVQAFQRQNLDLAIARWNNLLELDPNNQKAKLERERATDLKRRITEKFGG